MHASRAPKSLQDPPTEACGAPEHAKKPSDSLHGISVERPESPKRSQRASKDVPDTDMHDRSRLVSLPNTNKADESGFCKLREPPRASKILQEELVELPNTSRSHPGGLQTPTGTIDRDFRAFREASRHRQARQIVICEPPRHRQGR